MSNTLVQESFVPVRYFEACLVMAHFSNRILNGGVVAVNFERARV